MNCGINRLFVILMLNDAWSACDFACEEVCENEMDINEDEIPMGVFFGCVLDKLCLAWNQRNYDNTALAGVSNEEHAFLCNKIPMEFHSFRIVSADWLWDGIVNYSSENNIDSYIDGNTYQLFSGLCGKNFMNKFKFVFEREIDKSILILENAPEVDLEEKLLKSLCCIISLICHLWHILRNPDGAKSKSVEVYKYISLQVPNWEFSRFKG